MKPGSIAERALQMEDIMSVCYGMPKGDELPQVAGVEDILADVYSDLLNMPREFAVGYRHHQTVDDGLADERIH